MSVRESWKVIMNNTGNDWAVIVAQLLKQSLPIPEVRIQSGKLYVNFKPANVLKRRNYRKRGRELFNHRE